jgi:hypothetical protein
VFPDYANAEENHWKKRRSRSDKDTQNSVIALLMNRRSSQFTAALAIFRLLLILLVLYFGWLFATGATRIGA